MKVLEYGSDVAWKDLTPSLDVTPSLLFYNGWNILTAGFVGRQAIRLNQSDAGKLSDGNYWTATALDSVTSIISLVGAGKIANKVTARLGEGLWGNMHAGAAAGFTMTAIEKANEIGTYIITEGQTGYTEVNGEKGLHYGEMLKELGTTTMIGAGLPFLGAVMSGSMKGNFKVMWNSPNELNPTRTKLTQATLSEDINGLAGSLADSTGGNILSHAGGKLTTPSGKVIELPKINSLNAEEAANWLQAKGALIPELVNKNATLREQAFQAVKIQQDLTFAVRNAMRDANAAAQFNIADPAKTWEWSLREYSPKSSGDALYKKIVQEIKEVTTFRAVSMKAGCFIAGTLVHTKKGLVPIEEIKVGDWVLSQPEMKGEQAYKQVINTFVYDDKEVWIVRYYKAGGGLETIGVTGNHPFWVKDIGWTRADHLGNGDCIEASDGSTIKVLCVQPLYSTNEDEKIAFAQDVWGIESGDGSGSRIDLRSTPIRVEDEDAPLDILHGGTSEEQLYKSRVFNLEVEDFHTYYVGELGVWVHNLNCEGVVFVDAKVGLHPGMNTRVYDPAVATKVNLPGENRGVILVLEKGKTKATAVEFERGTEGALWDKDGNAVAWSLRTDGLGTSVDFIKLGDGRVIKLNRVTNTFIDAKSGNTPYGPLFGEDFSGAIQSKLRTYFLNLKNALELNPEYKHIIEFEPGTTGFAQARDFFVQEIRKANTRVRSFHNSFNAVKNNKT